MGAYEAASADERGAKSRLEVMDILAFLEEREDIENDDTPVMEGMGMSLEVYIVVARYDMEVGTYVVGAYTDATIAATVCESLRDDATEAGSYDIYRVEGPIKLDEDVTSVEAAKRAQRRALNLR